MADTPRADDIVADVLRRWPGTIAVFVGDRMACVGCAIAPYETIAEAAAIYHVPVDRLLASLADAAVNDDSWPHREANRHRRGSCHALGFAGTEPLEMARDPSVVRQRQDVQAYGRGRRRQRVARPLRQQAAKTFTRVGKPVQIVSIHEAGLDGFSVHRLLERNGIDSHVVDPASIAVPRRPRRAKTDAVDGATLLRTLMAWRRGKPRVCWMVVPPTPGEEDRRRISRECKVLLKERIEHVNRIKGLLANQGIPGYQPLRRDRRQRLDELWTRDGRPLPSYLKSEILREIERLELVLRHITEVEDARNALLCPKTLAALLTGLRGIGSEVAAVLWLKSLFRHFDNRRQLAAYAGLAPTPWKSGQIDRDQGISKAGNPRLRTTMIELAWLWQRQQPNSALSRWFRDRVGTERGRIRRIMIIAMVRKLLSGLWRYVMHGIVPEGARLRTA